MSLFLTHYLGEETTYTFSTLQPADDCVNEQKNHKILDDASFQLESAEISKMNREFMYFGHNVVKS